jgi:MFS family permease
MVLTSVFCQPLWGSYADKMGDRLRLGRLLLLGTLLRCAALLVAAATDVNTGNRVMIVMCMFVCAEGVMCGCLPVIDARVLSVLGDERRSLYGRQRLWGGIGWGLMAPVGGWMLGQYGLLATLCGHVVGMCVGMVCVSSLSGQGVSSVGTKGGVDSGRVVSLSEGISAVLSSPGVKSFLCVAVGIVSVSCSVPLTLCM